MLCGKGTTIDRTGLQLFRLSNVQYTKNARHHSGIGRSPFKAMFGKEASLGAQHLNLESGIAKHIANEEDIHKMLPREVVYSFLIVIYNSILKLE